MEGEELLTEVRSLKDETKGLRKDVNTMDVKRQRNVIAIVLLGATFAIAVLMVVLTFERQNKVLAKLNKATGPEAARAQAQASEKFKQAVADEVARRLAENPPMVVVVTPPSTPGGQPQVQAITPAPRSRSSSSSSSSTNPTPTTTPTTQPPTTPPSNPPSNPQPQPVVCLPGAVGGLCPVSYGPAPGQIPLQFPQLAFVEDRLFTTEDILGPVL